ncbi:hypothetical protein VIBNISO65_130019 [Vibrio nigripulchritudo SO65]|nr:hypothetical protein VIBNISO65_130019 [Vibrio nigripulchritudo SO65]
MLIKAIHTLFFSVVAYYENKEVSDYIWKARFLVSFIFVMHIFSFCIIISSFFPSFKRFFLYATSGFHMSVYLLFLGLLFFIFLPRVNKFKINNEFSKNKKITLYSIMSTISFYILANYFSVL